jgi:hypothetical protein
MPTLRLLLAALLAGLALGGCGGAPRADIVIGEAGCAEAHFVLPSSREPAITVENRAAAPMVLTLPRVAEFVTVAPGATATFALPRYLMGSFDYFCLGEAEHLSLTGGNPFLCASEPAEVAAVARSAGIFEIAPHDRIHEVGGGETP